MAGKTVRGDRLVIALISVLRTLVLELSKRGVLNADEFVYIVQQTAIAHRESGDPKPACRRHPSHKPAPSRVDLRRRVKATGELSQFQEMPLHWARHLLHTRSS